MDIVNNQLNCNSKHHDKCKFASKLIPVLTTSNLFPLEVVQNANIANLYYGKTRYRSGMVNSKSFVGKVLL